MKAITSSQRKYETASDSNALLKWTIQAKEIVWHLLRDSNEPLVELQLQDAQYHRTDNSDGSHKNLFQVGKVIGLNLLSDAMYPQMVAPYFEVDRSGWQEELNKKKMVRVYWHMLEAIAGIPVMDHFEVNLFPMRIQLEREIGKKLFEYIFPGTEGGKIDANSQDESPSIVRQNMSEMDDDAPEDSKSTGSGRLNSAASDKESAFSTRAGSLELRLRPTLTSDTPNVETSSQKSKAVSVNSGEESRFRLFSSKTASKKPSYESLRSDNAPKQAVSRSATAMTTLNDSKKPARFALLGRAGNANDKPSDDLTKMLTRASNYMTFVHIKMPSVVLCLSYKGKGDRNLEDVHDFVFRLPTIEFRNKTWSNLDLALALKSHVIKALISHTGAIISNKFNRHRPNNAQQSKLRELANSSVLLATPAMSSVSGNSGDTSDDSSSMLGASPMMDFSRSPPRSIRGVPASGSATIPIPPRPSSRSSSAASTRSFLRSNGGAGSGSPTGSIKRGTPVPGFTMMNNVAGHDGPPGLGIEMGRPHTSASNILGPLVRPGTSGSALRGGGGGDGNRDDTAIAGSGSSIIGTDRERRKSVSGGGFLRGTLNVLTGGRRKDRPDARTAEAAALAAAEVRPKTSSAASSFRLRNRADDDENDDEEPPVPGNADRGGVTGSPGPGFSWSGRTKTGL